MTRKILLVDDELSVRTMLQAVLEADNYSVVTAAGAADARAKLAAEHFDIVVTDMRMETPISGFEVAGAARRTFPNAVVIILTAYPIVEKDWRDAGADAGFSKPVSVAELLRVLEELLRHRTPDR